MFTVPGLGRQLQLERNPETCWQIIVPVIEFVQSVLDLEYIGFFRRDLVRFRYNVPGNPG